MRVTRVGVACCIAGLTVAGCGASTATTSADSPALPVTSTQPAPTGSTRPPTTVATGHRAHRPSTGVSTPGAGAPSATSTTPAAGPAPRRTAHRHPTSSPRPAPVTTTASTSGPCPASSSSARLTTVDDPSSPGSYAFSPTSLTVSCGGTLVLTNRSTAPHNVSPKAGGFTASGDVTPGGNASVRFSYRGTFGFYCSIHPYMTGTVHVT